MSDQDTVQTFAVNNSATAISLIVESMPLLYSMTRKAEEKN